MHARTHYLVTFRIFWPRFFYNKQLFVVAVVVIVFGSSILTKIISMSQFAFYSLSFLSYFPAIAFAYTDSRERIHNCVWYQSHLVEISNTQRHTHTLTYIKMGANVHTELTVSMRVRVHVCV